jgi:hypothetical protein
MYEDWDDERIDHALTEWAIHKMLRLSETGTRDEIYRIYAIAYEELASASWWERDLLARWYHVALRRLELRQR